MKYLRWLLFPFSLIYGLVVVVRNWFYDAGLFASRKFNLPIIAVGNLDVGGAGKSPMTEYLIRLLKSEYQLATLSRGYGRKTKGYVKANAITTATEIGDEPAQFHQKFTDITVAVCEERVVGIKELLPDHDLIILDDAYQHRAVTPGFSILLFDYNRLNEPHLLLPAGNLREPFSGRYRADVLIATKCPPTLNTTQQQRAIQQLQPLNYQPVFFTAIQYLPLQDIQGKLAGELPGADTTVFVLTGIANPQPLLQYIKLHTSNVIHHNYPDHHQFSLKNIAKLATEFNNCRASKKVIITTEKDAQRLQNPELLSHINTLPVWVLPIGISFVNNDGQKFNQLIQHYVKQYTTHRRLD
jgi:tetraacyldisaccharide 4'-kinase